MEFEANFFNPASLHLPWHQLKELRLNSPARVPHNNLRSILRKCTLLEVCMVTLDTLAVEEDLNGAITLSHLEVLAITINVNLGTRFFESMALPQLKELTLAVLLQPETQVFGGFSVDLQPLVNLQRASNFSLQRLVLINMGVEQEELLEVLQLMNSLMTASLIFVRGLDELFFSAFEDNSDTALLPSLSAFKTDCSTFPISNLQAILESRGYPRNLSTSKPPTVAKLQRLTLVVEVSFDPSPFEKFEGSGLDLTLDRVIGREGTPESESEGEEELMPEPE